MVILVVGFIFIKSRQNSQSVQQSQVTSTLPLAERPYVSLTSDSAGHSLKLDATRLSQIKTVEYELVYLAGDVSRGVIGSIDLNIADSLSRDLLLGSCSKNVCKYDEGVNSGTLTLTLRGQSGNQKYDSPFLLEQGSKDKKDLTLDDGNFKYSGTLPLKNFFVFASTVGLPKVPDGKVVGGPYGIFSSGDKKIKGTITIKLAEPTSSVKVLDWDGSSWKEISSGLETDGQSVSVDINTLGTFVVVAS